MTCGYGPWSVRCRYGCSSAVSTGPKRDRELGSTFWSMHASDDDAHRDILSDFTDEDRKRINGVITKIGGIASSAEASERLNIVLTELRIAAERRANARLGDATENLAAVTKESTGELKAATEKLVTATNASSSKLLLATWVLAGATIVLAVATILSFWPH